MSDNIFAEIYNKILSLFGQNVKDESKNTAVNRLRLVLMQDRTNLTPEIMNRMRSELIAVLSKYVELDQEALDLNIGQEGEQMALMLSIPVIRAKDEAEIEQALKEEEEAKKAALEEDKENDSDDKESEDSKSEEENETEASEEKEEEEKIAEEEKDLDETSEENSEKEQEEIENDGIATESPTPKTKKTKKEKEVEEEKSSEE